jgi:hypothetical protein
VHLAGGGVITAVVIFLYAVIAGYALYSRRERPLEESMSVDRSGRGYVATHKSPLPPEVQASIGSPAGEDWARDVLGPSRAATRGGTRAPRRTPRPPRAHRRPH